MCTSQCTTAARKLRNSTHRSYVGSFQRTGTFPGGRGPISVRPGLPIVRIPAPQFATITPPVCHRVTLPSSYTPRAFPSHEPTLEANSPSQAPQLCCLAARNSCRSPGASGTRERPCCCRSSDRNRSYPPRRKGPGRGRLLPRHEQIPNGSTGTLRASQHGERDNRRLDSRRRPDADVVRFPVPGCPDRPQASQCTRDVARISRTAAIM